MSYQDARLRIYSAVVNCLFLGRDTKLAYTQYLNEQDLPTRQEFLIRDARQFTGVSDCQARSANKLDYHLNTSLNAINVAKSEQASCPKVLSWSEMMRKCANSISSAV